MSGKFEKKKQSKHKYAKRKSHRWLWITLAVVLIAVAATAAFLYFSGDEIEPPTEPSTSATEAATIPSSETQTIPAEEEGLSSFVLGEELEILDLGSYTGAYMEDGSDEIVSNVLMIVVTNNGENTLQYAEITLTGEAGDAEFSLSTLNPGESMVVLEKNRKTYASGDSYTDASARNVVFFSEPISLYEDQLQIQPLEGGFNITNISGEDITGDITIYFKDSANGVLYGGITYRGRIEGGLKAGEIRQIMSENFSASGTTVMFVTITEE